MFKRWKRKKRDPEAECLAYYATEVLVNDFGYSLENAPKAVDSPRNQFMTWIQSRKVLGPRLFAEVIKGHVERQRQREVIDSVDIVDMGHASYIPANLAKLDPTA